MVFGKPVAGWHRSTDQAQQATEDAARRQAVRRRSGSRGVAAAVATLVLALAVAACGSSSGRRQVRPRRHPVRPILLLRRRRLRHTRAIRALSR